MSMVRESSATVASGVSRIPFERVSRIRRLGAAHAKGAGADEYPAHRGAHRRDGRHRPGHHPRHRAGSKLRSEFDVRQILANWAGVDLTRINGVAATTVMKLLTEIGPDLSRFADVKHFLLAGTVPGHQDQRRQSAAQRLGAGRVLQATVRPHGQASREHRHRP